MAETGILRQPRAWVNGMDVISVEVHLVRLAQPSTFHATIAADDPNGPGMAFWANISAPLPVTVTADNGDGSGAGVLFIGKIWDVTINWEQRTAVISGADATQDLINTRNYQAYPNQPTTGVVSQIAGQAGLGVVTGAGGQMAGRTYDNQNYQYNSDVQNAWDVIQDMANQDGAVAYVNKQILYYVMPGNSMGGVFEIFYVPPTPFSYCQSNAMSLQTSHDLHLAQGVQAQAASWFPYLKQANTSGSDGASGGGTGGGAGFYERHSGLTQNQAQDQMQRLMQFAQTQELKIRATVPGDVSVEPNMMVSLTGTGSVFDTSYFIEQVTHEISWNEGYVMHIDGKTGGASGGGGGGG